MQHREIFGLIVRIAGLGLLIFAIIFAAGLVTDALGVEYRGANAWPVNLAGLFVYGVPGLTLIFWADGVVRLTYGPEK